MSTDRTVLPLLVLSDAVCFPRTEVLLHVPEADLRERIEELWLNGAVPRLATALQKPDREPTRDGSDLFPAGTAGRVMRIEAADEGGCDIVLRGEYRFELEREVTTRTFREVLVRPVREPRLSELDPGIREVRGELVTVVGGLAAELGTSFDLDADQMRALHLETSFEALVNRLATELDLAPIRKLRLLSQTLPDRALHLLELLRSRRRVLDVLRPYRHLAEAAELN